MQLLEHSAGGIKLVNEAWDYLTSLGTVRDQFIDPFILCMDGSELSMIGLEGFSTPEIKSALGMIKTTVSQFVLAAETVVENPKTGFGTHFFVVKLFVDGLENSYVYSTQLTGNSEDRIQVQAPLRFVGSEANPFFDFHPLSGEGSSVNAIKMDNEGPYDYSAAFLIGHLNEGRLWADTKMFIADLYCKVGLDSTHQYSFIFEVSKFGQMTDSMKLEFSRTKTYFEQQFFPRFAHINAVMRSDNTSLVYPN